MNVFNGIHVNIFVYIPNILTAVTFLEYWKRKRASLAHHWDCLDFQEEAVSIISFKIER